MKHDRITNHNYLVKLTYACWLPALLLIFACTHTKSHQTPSRPANSINPPTAKKINKKLVAHGHTRIDPYFWLNQRTNPEVIAYLEAENLYTQTMMKHTQGLQNQLFDEITGRIKKDEASVPIRLKDYYYYKRFETNREYPLYCRKQGDLNGQEQILLDINQLAKGHAFFHVNDVFPSNDHAWLAFGTDAVSRRMYTLHFKNLLTGEILNEQIPDTDGRVAWAADNRTVFYVTKDPTTLRPFRVHKHVLESDPVSDLLVYEEKDDTFSVYVKTTKSKRYVTITLKSTLSDEIRFLKSDRPEENFLILQPRERGLEYSVEHFGGHFYVLTNWQAKNFRLLRAPVGNPGKKHWEQVVPHREDVLLVGFEIFRNHLVLQERRQGLSQLCIRPWRGSGEHQLRFDEAAYTAHIDENPEFDTSVLRLAYSSLTTPNSIYDYDMITRKKTLRKRDEVVGSFDPGWYETKRLLAPAQDDSLVPISMVYRKGLKRNGDNPLLLYGYGSYGHSLEPNFHTERLSLIDRGFIFAIAHIRGGQELGRRWYEDGKLLNKKNTFHDFIACAEHLVTEKYTRPEKLFAMGGSAGGLLMGAVLNMRPDLFHGVVATVPWVDVVTTMLDDSIPLTTIEYDEWGNPNQKIYYDYMLSYSPYDNVRSTEYPALLVTTGLHDSQVQYWEPAKWVAKLRTIKTDRHPLLLHTNMKAGHGGASGRFRRYQEYALIYAFMLDQLDIRK